MGQLVFQATLGGQVNLVGPNTASTFNINVPAVAGNMVTTGDTGTVTNTMLASSAYTAPGTIGSGTPNSGAFTTLSASSTVSGTGFSTYLASPPAIGGTAAAAGSFTALSYTTTLTGGTGIVNLGSGQFYKDASGNVGIGTSSPSYKLHVNDGTSASIVASTPTSDVQIAASSSGFGLVGTVGNYPLVMRTNGTERGRFDASGNLLVGTTTTNSRLTVKAQSSAYSEGISSVRSGGTDWWSILSASNTNLYFGYNNTDKAYINSTTGAFTAISDNRLKKNIIDIQYGLQSILALRPVTYNMSEQEDTDVKALGFIAQEALEVVPESVSEMMSGFYGMDKVALVPVLVKAIQEQQALITQLQDDVAALKAPQ